MSCFIKIKVNNEEDLALQLPDKDFLEMIRNDGSLLLNTAQEFVKEPIHTVELMEEIVENDDNNPPNVDKGEVTQDEKKMWTDDNTKRLIQLCKEYDNEFQTGIKKIIWNKIAKIISEATSAKVTGVQCDTKWKGLQKQYKIIKTHNETSGNQTRYWKFYNVMHEILHKKPEIKPVATCSSAAGLQTDESTSSSPKSTAPSSPSTSRSSTPTSSVTRKRKVVENSVERRHQERLERQDRFLNILENIAKNMKNKRCQCNDEDDEN